MYTVIPKKGEEIEVTLKRLKSKIIQDGMMEELYRLRSYENPRDKKKRKIRLMHKKMAMMKKKR
jgi:ribosomal protein S21